jgi:hypothetical protein
MANGLPGAEDQKMSLESSNDWSYSEYKLSLPCNEFGHGSIFYLNKLLPQGLRDLPASMSWTRSRCQSEFNWRKGSPASLVIITTLTGTSASRDSGRRS